MLCNENLMVVEILVMRGKCNGNIRWRYNWLSFHAIGNILLPQFHFSRIKTPPSVWPHTCKQNRKHFLLSNLTGLLISCNLILSFFVIFTNSPFKITRYGCSIHKLLNSIGLEQSAANEYWLQKCKGIILRVIWSVSTQALYTFKLCL